jgi:transcription termination factor Rho
VSWFRSSRRRRSAEAPAAPPAPAGPPRPARDDLEERPLADLHALAAEWEVPRYRLLRRGELIAAISGQPAPSAPEAQPAPPVEPRPQAEPEPEPEPQAEPQPQAEPEPEPEELAEGELAEGELRTGILDLVGEGYGFVRIDGLTRSAEDPYVSRTLVRQFSLRRGEEITGRVVPGMAGERHARMVTVEWRSPAEPAPIIFDAMPAKRPSRPLRTAPGADAFGPRMAELVSPLAIGQRALVAGPPRAGATHLLREVARGLIGGQERLIVALVDVRPEEVPE